MLKTCMMPECHEPAVHQLNHEERTYYLCDGCYQLLRRLFHERRRFRLRFT